MKTLFQNKSYIYVLATFCFSLLALPLSNPFLGLFSLVVAVILLIRIDIRGVLVLSFPTVSLLGVGLSLVFIEQGAYISEQFRNGWNVSAASAFSCYAICFLLIGHFAIGRIAKIPSKIEFAGDFRTITYLIVALASVITVVYLFIFIFFGTGLTYSARFDWTFGLPELIFKILGLVTKWLVPTLFGLVGLHQIVASSNKIKNQFLITILGVPIVLMFVAGEKFSGFIAALMFYLTGVGLGLFYKDERFRFRLKPRFLLLFSLLALFLFISLFYGYQRLGANDFVDALINRITLQGHVWFGIWEQFKGKPSVNPVDIFGPNSISNPAGLDYISYLISNKEFVFKRISTQGLSFTMGGPPGLLAAFGFWGGLSLLSIGSLIYSALFTGVLYFLRNGYQILLIPVFFLFVTAEETFLMGRWDTFYGTVTFGVLFFMLIVVLFKLLFSIKSSKPI